MTSRDGRRLQRCREHGLSYDPDVAAGCVLCRRSLRVQGSPGAWQPAQTRFVFGLVTSVAIVCLAAVYFMRLSSKAGTRLGEKDPSSVAPALGLASAVPPNAASPLPGALPAIEVALTARNAAGRSGYLFVPAREPQETLQLLVGLHGQGGDGREMLGAFRGLAVEHRFAILAPSSGYVAEMRVFTWRVGDKPNDFTDDFQHVKACLDEVLARPDVKVDPGHALIAGFSGGASSAPYVATNTGPYSAFAVLHGGVFPGGIGPRKVPGWFSTGDTDPLRTPAHVFGHFSTMRDAGFSVTYKTYAGGHVVSPREAAELADWWLGLSP